MTVRVGVVGGGQLARMMIAPAVELGLEIRVLAEEPVLATASTREDTAFVRVLLLPAGWSGKRTIRYVDPADEDKPRLQRATVLSEEPLAL